MTTASINHQDCVYTGQVAASPFRLIPSRDGESPSGMHAWLEKAQTDSPIDQVPDVSIETGVFKVLLLTASHISISPAQDCKCYTSSRSFSGLWYPLWSWTEHIQKHVF